MLKALVILSFVAGAICLVLPDGMDQQLEERIIGGSNAKISDYPYLVSVLRFGNYACMGTIFRPTLIITAAQCLQRVTPTSLRIRAGSVDWNSSGVLGTVLTYKIHEHYNAATMENDIAVIRLTAALTLTVNVQPIPLAMYPLSSNYSASVAGWGATAAGSAALAATLQATTMTILSQADCASSKYGYGANIKESMICALKASGGPGACDGDVGAPLVAGGALVGVYSWGYDCALSYYPSVYADVSNLSFWLLNTAKFI